MKHPVLAAGCLWLLLCNSSWASPKKDDVTAAMVYRLTKFVEWPPEALPVSKSSFLICFDQPTAVYKKLMTAKLKQRRGLDIELSLSVNNTCHVVVVSKDKPPLDLSNTLIIGTTDDFLDQGGHICLKFSRGRLEFSINRSAAENSGLEMSSQLLTLASEVR